MSKNFCSYVTTGRFSQMALRGRGYSQQWGKWQISLWGGFFFSLVTNSTLKLKINICILELLILFFEDIIFLYYIQVIGFCFFLRKIYLSHVFHCFISLWVCPWFHDVSYMVNNSFFSKNREEYFHKPIYFFELLL